MPSALLSYCFGEISLGVSRAILHQAIAIVKDQVGIDFDIPQSNLVGLQLISVVTNQIVMRWENRRIFARFRSHFINFPTEPISFGPRLRRPILSAKREARPP
jgi:hypothetical protein